MDTQTLNRLETTAEIRRRKFVPERLADARRAAGLKQREAAEVIGRDIRQYQRIESGEVNPTLTQLGTLAATLGVTIDSLFAPVERPADAP